MSRRITWSKSLNGKLGMAVVILFALTAGLLIVSLYQQSSLVPTLRRLDLVARGRSLGYRMLYLLADTVSESATAATQIVASAGQQANGVSQINRAMKNIDAATKQTLAATRQTEQAAGNLNELGQRLQALMSGDGNPQTA